MHLTTQDNQCDLSLIICCYNEEKILEKNLSRILHCLDNLKVTYEILIIDDCSQDRTKKICLELQQKYRDKNIRFFYHGQNRGRGATVKHGIEESRGKVVGFIDIDLEVGEWYIMPCFLAIRDKNYDVVCGFRVYNIRLSPYLLIRHFLSHAYRKLIRISINTRLKDTESGYKFFNREKVLPLVLKTTSDHWFWDTEIMLRAELAGLKIVEIPCLFIRNLEKKSTVKIVKDSLIYLKDLWYFKHQLSKDKKN